jgi:hypothetical protein
VRNHDQSAWVSGAGSGRRDSVEALIGLRVIAANVTITLPAVEYVLRFKTDDAHDFGGWNRRPPDGTFRGILLYRDDASTPGGRSAQRPLSP